MISKSNVGTGRHVCYRLCYERLEDIGPAIRVNGECINNIRYADDKVVFADNSDKFLEIILQKQGRDTTVTEYNTHDNL